VKVLRGAIILLILFGAGVGAYERFVNVKTPPSLFYAAVSRGDVVMTVNATGTLQATRTVDVGTQVSGTVKRLYVDYNSIVKKGELIAEIDPLLSQQALSSAEAARDRADIDLKQEQDTLAIDTKNRDRAEDMFTHQVGTEQDKETAELQVKTDQAVIDQDKAALVIADANVEQAKVTLDFCTIRSPIDGVVVSRNADEGQTVQASLTVPSLYVIATDIGTLELSGQVDESDIGKLHPGQDATFTVDAYPGQTFHGTMTHVRLYATTVNNVVTYQAIVLVKNPELRLLPSMTANMKVEVARASDTLRVPNTALRFRPSHDMFDAIGQAPITPPSLASAAAKGPTSLLPLPSTDSASAVGPGGTPMIDTMFSAAPHPRAPGQVWVMRDGKLQVVPVTVGITDGALSELIDGNLQLGDELVTMVSVPAKKPAAPTAASPLMPPGRGGPTPPRPPTGR
jgi:HlyD family secretion protein